jgi:CubicO group peptidase (beta-lactamase class C family)
MQQKLSITLVWIVISTGAAYAEQREPGALLPDGHMKQVRSEAYKLIQGMLNKEQVPGLSLALVDRNGPVWVEGFGKADLERGSPVDGRTVSAERHYTKDKHRPY